ncbi:hypothetical protein F2Q68_00030677 [Brassica cretica]|uniref:F-box domain-containing protein n=2 Tax=Brassica cretica TaxID=69181 RepID=A0ABQ7BG92_BRACR|nr:hypothetical protein F2Q68_00030677 [Brassica cretica]KAF3530945.1 hypothetical protein DY000_02039233 [Brassica cretica]
METQQTLNVSWDSQRNTLSKTSDNVREGSSASPIPTDVIVDIFSRLPLKSIAICRCVSKLWASVLRLPDFTELFLTKSCTRPQQLLHARVTNSELFLFSSSASPHPDENSSPPPIVASRHMKLSFGGFGEISCGRPVYGLVCVKHVRVLDGEKETALAICNPSTRQVLHLPKVETETRRLKLRSMFGYDPVDKQYKVLCMTSDGGHFQVLTLGSPNRSWRMLECCIPHYDYPLLKEICIDGVLYYKSINQSTQTYLIVCFDVRSEMFRPIESKGSLGRAVLTGDMVNYGGRLGLITCEDNRGNVGAINRRSSRFKLWVLEDVEKQEWSERVFVLPAEWKNVVGEHRLNFVGVASRTNEIVLSSWYPINRFYLFYFDPEIDTVVRVEMQGVDMDVSNYAVLQTFLDHVEDVKLYA